MWNLVSGSRVPSSGVFNPLTQAQTPSTNSFAKTLKPCILNPDEGSVWEAQRGAHLAAAVHPRVRAHICRGVAAPRGDMPNQSV